MQYLGVLHWVYNDGGQDMVVAVEFPSLAQELMLHFSVLSSVDRAELQSPSSTILGAILAGTHGDLPFRKPIQGSLRAW